MSHLASNMVRRLEWSAVQVTRLAAHEHPAGAGKSSLLVLLFRINEPSGGLITLDGQDISQVGLQTLRQAMCIIPQDPLLLRGTVRRNLDPFERHDNKKLLNVSLVA